MKPIDQSWCMQIEATSYCAKDCLYCSRYIRHTPKKHRWFMDLNYMAKCLDALKDWPLDVPYGEPRSLIGIIGGEPIMHPQFEEMCELLLSKFPKRYLGLWTAGFPEKRWKEVEKIARSTFGFLAYNEHNVKQVELCQPQPITVAIEEVVQDTRYREMLIDDCWVQRTWCPTISPKGGFFCEVAYAIDQILEGPGGYDATDPGWWIRAPENFRDQRDRYCGKCGMAIPMERQTLDNRKHQFTPNLLALFRQHSLPGMGEDRVELFTGQFSIEELEANKSGWYPGNYRGDIQSDETCREGPGSTWRLSDLNLTSDDLRGEEDENDQG